MSFKDTILPDFVVAELYGNLLIQTSEAAASAPMPPARGKLPEHAGSKPGAATKTGSAPVHQEIEIPESRLPGMPATTESIKPLPSVAEKENNAVPELVATVQTSVGPYRYLGKNQKKISVIARYAHDPFIPEQHLEFLTKLLSACKLNLGDVAIINDSVQAINFNKLKEELAPGFVLLFDIQPGEIGLPLSFPLLKAQSFSNCVFLTIPAIADLLPATDEVKETKKKLWDSLKKMFL